jgi:hypothetical protein
MSIGEVKRDLNVLIRILDDDQTIVVDVRILKFAFEKDGAAFLDFNGTQVGGLEMRNDIGVGERLDVARFGLGFWFRGLGGEGDTDPHNGGEGNGD